MTNTNNSSNGNTSGNTSGNTNLKTVAIMTTIIIAITTFAYSIYNNKLDKDIYELQEQQIEQRFDRIDSSLDKIYDYIIKNKKD